MRSKRWVLIAIVPWFATAEQGRAADKTTPQNQITLRVASKPAATWIQAADKSPPPQKTMVKIAADSKQQEGPAIRIVVSDSVRQPQPVIEAAEPPQTRYASKPTETGTTIKLAQPNQNQELSVEPTLSNDQAQQEALATSTLIKLRPLPPKFAKLQPHASEVAKTAATTKNSPRHHEPIRIAEKPTLGLITPAGPPLQAESRVAADLPSVAAPTIAKTSPHDQVRRSFMLSQSVADAHSRATEKSRLANSYISLAPSPPALNRQPTPTATQTYEPTSPVETAVVAPQLQLAKQAPAIVGDTFVQSDSITLATPVAPTTKVAIIPNVESDLTAETRENSTPAVDPLVAMANKPSTNIMPSDDITPIPEPEVAAEPLPPAHEPAYAATSRRSLNKSPRLAMLAEPIQAEPRRIELEPIPQPTPDSRYAAQASPSRPNNNYPPQQQLPKQAPPQVASAMPYRMPQISQRQFRGIVPSNQRGAAAFGGRAVTTQAPVFVPRNSPQAANLAKPMPHQPTANRTNSAYRQASYE